MMEEQENVQRQANAVPVENGQIQADPVPVQNGQIQADPVPVQNGQVQAGNAEQAVKPQNEQPKEPTEPEGPVLTFTEEQMQRVVNCRTHEGVIVQAPWHLMMQSRTFANMWQSLGAEENVDNCAYDNFEFLLNEITNPCFQKVLEWMRAHHGKPEPVLKNNPITTERIWFELTEWEKQFFQMNFEDVKECYLASNFLDLRSLYYYCAQECARAVMDKEPEQIREMLGLPDDLSEEDKQQIRKEFEINDGIAESQPSTSGIQTEAEQDRDQPGPSGIQAEQNGEQPGTSETTKQPKVEQNEGSGTDTKMEQ